MTYGAKKSLHASERDTPRVVAPRQDFVETVAQPYDTRRFHFLDETGLRLDAYRCYARAKGGQRVGQAVPLKRRPSLTLIGPLSAQGGAALRGGAQLRTFRAVGDSLPGPYFAPRRCAGA